MTAAMALLVLAAVVFVAVALACTVWFGQRHLIYRPERGRVSPSSEGLRDVAEVILPTPDGAKLVGWYARPVEDRPVVLYFHGNGGGLYDRSARVRILQAEGYGVLLMSYRGYSGSTGKPSEPANIADALLAYDWLRAACRPGQGIVLFGESLGTGVAVQVGTARDAAGVILDSPFTSLVDVAAMHFPFVPVRLFLRDRYASTEYIGRLRAPLLILHGEQDRVVPFELGRRLFAAAHEPKQFCAFPGVGHLVPFDGAAWPISRAFLEDVARRAVMGRSER